MVIYLNIFQKFFLSSKSRPLASVYVASTFSPWIVFIFKNNMFYLEVPVFKFVARTVCFWLRKSFAAVMVGTFCLLEDRPPCVGAPFRPWPVSGRWSHLPLCRLLGQVCGGPYPLRVAELHGANGHSGLVTLPITCVHTQQGKIRSAHCSSKFSLLHSALCSSTCTLIRFSR